MTIKELKQTLDDQAFAMKKAKTRGFMVNQETEKMRNILVNNLDDILAALDVAIKAEEKIARLVIEIENADAELAEKDDEIKALKEAVDKPVGKRRKLPVVEDGVE
ncbi:MAG: hypothetical protein J6Q02_10720 [Lachnospiraceae bacterium]|nr:hypothetical protein [Lachnospiraceae bacterium]